MESIASNTVSSSISVVIASKGRPDFLIETIESLQRQTLKPKQIIIVVPSIEDLPKNQWGDEVQYIVGTLGLTSQRNRGIKAIPTTVPSPSSMLPRFPTTIGAESVEGHDAMGHDPRAGPVPPSATDRICPRAGGMWSTRESAAARATRTCFAAADSVHQAAAVLEPG